MRDPLTDYEIAVRVRSTPAFAVRASWLPFSVSGIAPRTADVLQEFADQRRAAQGQLPPAPFAALPPAPAFQPPPGPAFEAPPSFEAPPAPPQSASAATAPPPAPPPAQPQSRPERAAFRYDEDAIEARFIPAPPPPPRAPEPLRPEPPRPEPPPLVAEPAAAAPVAEPPPALVVEPPPAPVEEPVASAAVEAPVAEPAEPPEAAEAALEPPPAVEPPPVVEPPAAVEAPVAAPRVEAAAEPAQADATTLQPPELAMPDADVAAGAVAPLPEQPEHVDDVAAAQAPAAPVAAAPVAPPEPPPAPPEPAAAPADAAPAPVASAPPEPVAEPEPQPVTRRVRLVFARDALERALTFLEQSDYGGLITHLFAIRTLLPTAFVGLNGDVPGRLAAEREALRGVVDRLFIKMRMPRYALTGKDLEDRSSRSALLELVRSLRDSMPAEDSDPGDATVVLEGPIDVARMTPHVSLLESEPLGSARPWLLLAELLPSSFVVPRGGEAMNAYRSALITTFTNVAALPSEEFHRVLAGTQNAALDGALRDVRLALRDALEAAAAKA